MDAWTTIRYLHAQGKGIRAIAQEVGVARNTVRAALREPESPRYQRAARPNPQLTPFGDLIRRFVVEQQLIGSRILRELRAAGYTGGLYQVNVLIPAATPPGLGIPLMLKVAGQLSNIVVLALQ